MASCSAIGDDFQAEAAYFSSFGNLGHKSLYSGYRHNTPDVRSELYKNVSDNMVQLKTQLTTAGGAGTAGYAMIPVYVDPMIIDQTRKFTPLTEIIPRVTNRGMYADYNNITAKGGAFTGAENQSLSATDTTYDRFSTAIKFLYAVGSVSGQVQVAQPSYVMQGFQPSGSVGSFGNSSAPNAKQMKVLEKTREIKELEENLILNGNSTTSGVTGDPNGTEFDGIISLMGSTNTVDKNTSALKLSDLDLAVRYAFDDGGRPNLAVCSSGVWNDIRNLILQKFGYMQPMEEVFWGFKTIVLKSMVGDIPIVPSMFMSNVSGSKAIYFLDLSVVEMRVLQDLTYFDLAVTRDASDFALKIYEALIIRNTSFCSSVTEISA